MAKKTLAAEKLLRQTKISKKKIQGDSGANFSRFIENSHDVIYQLDVKSKKYDFVSPACNPVFGIPVKVFINQPVWLRKDKIHPLDRSALAKHAREIFSKKSRGKKNFRLEYRVLFKNDEAKWIVDRHTVFYNGKGEPETIVGTARDITFRKNTQDELTGTYNLQKKYLDLLLSIQNALPAPVALLDKDGNIISVNEVWEKERGGNPYFGPSLTIGMNYLKAWQEMSKDGMHNGKETAAGLKKVLQSGANSFSDDYIVEKGSRRQWYRMLARPINRKRREGAVVMHIDVTEKNKAVEALERRNKEISRLYEVEKQLSSTLEPSVIYDKIYHIISELMGCDSMIISSYNRDDNMIKCLSVWADGNKVDPSDFPLIPLAPEGHGIQSPVIRSGKPKIIFDYKNEFQKSKYQITRSSGPGAAKKPELYCSAIMIPLKLEGNVIGTLQVLSRKKNAYGDEDLRVLEAVSSHISAATANALLYQQAQNEIAERTKAEEALKKRTGEISLLYDSYVELTSALEPTVIYEKVYHILARIMPCDAMMISSYDEKTNLIRPVSVWQGKNKHDADSFPILPANKNGEGTQSRVIITGEPLFLNDYLGYFDKLSIKYLVDENGKMLPHVSQTDTLTRSAMLVPMKIENRVIGVITVFSYRKNSYSHDDLSLLQALSTQLSAATVNALLYQQAQNEIQQRIKSENELKMNKEKLENAQTVAHLGSWELDPLSEEIFFSDEMFRICGIERQEKGMTLSAAVELFHPDERNDITLNFEKMRNSGNSVSSERRILRPDGSLRYVRMHTRAVKGDDGKTSGFIGTVYDITELKQINQELVKSVEEKELMIKEIHHRVKNNLQVVSSLLRMQSETVTDKTAIEHLKISEQRVKSMALIHQQLYKTQDLSRIDFKEYVNDLSMYLYHAYSIVGGKVKLTVDVNEIFFGIDTALPCGLIINELLTNSLKHAFPGDKDGVIEIRLHKGNDGKNILVVKDNGIGITRIGEVEKAPTLGMKLVNTLTEQLEAKLKMENDNGLKVTITFDDLIYKHRI